MDAARVPYSGGFRRELAALLCFLFPLLAGSIRRYAHASNALRSCTRHWNSLSSNYVPRFNVNANQCHVTTIPQPGMLAAAGYEYFKKMSHCFSTEISESASLTGTSMDNLVSGGVHAKHLSFPLFCNYQTHQHE